MRKVYERYKLIETKDIEAHRLIPRNGFDVRDYVLAKRRIKSLYAQKPRRQRRSG